jgi:hypothetical protein
MLNVEPGGYLVANKICWPGGRSFRTRFNSGVTPLLKWRYQPPLPVSPVVPCTVNLNTSGQPGMHILLNLEMLTDYSHARYGKSATSFSATREQANKCMQTDFTVKGSDLVASDRYITSIIATVAQLIHVSNVFSWANRICGLIRARCVSRNSNINSSDLVPWKGLTKV